MSRWALPLTILGLSVYALSGIFVVRGNEKAAVRRFGRLTLPLRPSGLHFDWPYPFARVTRINLAAVQTVTIGGEEPAASGSMLTGDQNLLQVRAQVLYRPLESEIGDYLFGLFSPSERVAQLAEAILVELLSQSGVDFAHVRGLSDLNERLTNRLRLAAAEQHLGIEVEQAVIEQVEPPVRVKADFLDVSNARAEQARSVQEARTWAEQKLAQAQSESRRIVESAVADRQARLAAAKGAADRFRKLTSQMREEAERGGRDYADVRRLTVQRMSWETLTTVWPKVRKKAIIESAGPVDVGVFPNQP